MTSLFKTLASSTVLVIAGTVAFGAMAQTPIAPVAPAAAASSPRTHGNATHGKGMKNIDTNQDKMISRDEAKDKPKLAQRFDAIDTNKDGQLSRDEMKAYRQAQKGQPKEQVKS